MNVSRLVSLAAALVLTATEWAAFFTLPADIQAAQAVAAPVASNAPDADLPVIVVTARRAP